MTKVLRYNPYRIYEKLDRIPQELIKPGSLDIMLKHQNTHYEKIGQPFIDRSGFYPHFLNVHLDPVPACENFNMSFHELCDVRAKFLLSLNRTLNVMWSGGIDSTCALFSLIRNADASQRRKIRVILNYNSIYEGGTLFDKHIRGKFDYHLTVTNRRGALYTDPIFKDKSLFVTGALGDQLMGRNDIMADKDFGQLMSPPDYPLDDVKSERPIETLADVFWYQCFYWNWNSAKYYHFFLVPQDIQQRFHHFYDTDDFQRWAIAHKESAFNGSKETYKWPMRKVIMEYTNDKTYAITKLKQTSQHSYWGLDWLVLLDNGETITC